MSRTAAPNIESIAPAAGAGKAGRVRRKPAPPPLGESAARRTRMVQLVIFAIAAVITIDAVVGDKGLLETFRARREQTQLLNEINRIRYDNTRKREYARRLREDPRAIEEAARRNLGLVKSGEVLVIVKDAENR
jgi:cell division protein FtsB